MQFTTSLVSHHSTIL